MAGQSIGGDAAMDARRARDVLDLTERARRAARSDVATSALPLLVFGPLFVVYGLLAEFWLLSPLDTPGGHTDDFAWFMSSLVSTSYWLLAGTLALVVVGMISAVRAYRIGAGPGAGAWFIAGRVLVLVMFFAVPVWLPLYPLPTVALMLLFVAWRLRSRQLAIWAVVVGVVSGLANAMFIDNRFYDVFDLLGFGVVSKPDWLNGDNLAFVLLGVALTWGGLRARRAGGVARP